MITWSCGASGSPRSAWRPAANACGTGTPKAWQAGFRYDGVKVAVLDTGYDAEHPDLKSIVDASVDFTGEGVNDTVGHGTHVASTIAGSGAASHNGAKVVNMSRTRRSATT